MPVWTDEMRDAQRQRMLGKDWGADTNAKRAESLRGRRLSMEHRAALYASRLYGGSSKGTPEWDAAYEQRLFQLQSAHDISQAVEMGEIVIDPNDPAIKALNVRITKRQVDPERIRRLIEQGRLNPSILNR